MSTTPAADAERAVADWRRQRVKVTACTYQRPALLERLLRGVAALHDAHHPDALSMVVVDDSPAGEGAEVVRRVAAETGLVVEYVPLGSQNISTARTTALETALVDSDWVAFLDDDCAPRLDWLDRMFDVQRDHGADIVTSGVRYVTPPEAPGWMHQDNLMDDFDPYGDGDVPEHGCMANVLLRSDWFRTHTDVRFARHLGETGGEDMMFLDLAAARGAAMRWSSSGLVDEQLAPDRLSLRYMWYRAFWWGNNNVLVNLQTGWSTRKQLILRVPYKMLKLGLDTLSCVVRPSHFKWRRRGADFVLLVGMATGLVGIRFKHR